MDDLFAHETLPAEENAVARPSELLLDFVMGEPLRKRYEASKGKPDESYLLTREVLQVNKSSTFPNLLECIKATGGANNFVPLYQTTIYKKSLFDDPLPLPSVPQKQTQKHNNTAIKKQKSLKIPPPPPSRNESKQEQAPNKRQKRCKRKTKPQIIMPAYYGDFKGEIPSLSVIEKTMTETENALPIFEIMGRKINFDQGWTTKEPSLYSLLRSWVQDDPYRTIPPPPLSEYSVAALQYASKESSSPSLASNQQEPQERQQQSETPEAADTTAATKTTTTTTTKIAMAKTSSPSGDTETNINEEKVTLETNPPPTPAEGVAEDTVKNINSNNNNNNNEEIKASRETETDLQEKAIATKNPPPEDMEVDPAEDVVKDTVNNINNDKEKDKEETTNGDQLSTPNQGSSPVVGVVEKEETNLLDQKAEISTTTNTLSRNDTVDDSLKIAQAAPESSSDVDKRPPQQRTSTGPETMKQLPLAVKRPSSSPPTSLVPPSATVMTATTTTGQEKMMDILALLRGGGEGRQKTSSSSSCTDETKKSNISSSAGKKDDTSTKTTNPFLTDLINRSKRVKSARRKESAKEFAAAKESLKRKGIFI